MFDVLTNSRYLSLSMYQYIYIIHVIYVDEGHKEGTNQTHMYHENMYERDETWKQAEKSWMKLSAIGIFILQPRARWGFLDTVAPA